MDLKQWLGSKQQLVKIQCQSICLNGIQICASTEVTCLGVRLDSQLTWPLTSNFWLATISTMWQIRTVRQSLNTDSAKALVHALIACCLDYFNSVLHQINTSAAKTLQSVLHSAARLLMRKRKFDSITRHLEMIFTGYQCHRGLFTNCVLLSTGVCITLLPRSTFKSCAC